MLRIVRQVGFDVRQDRLFAEVVLDDPWNVGVDDLVVRDAGPDRVGEGDVARAVGVHQARHAERRVGPEDQRVEEVVVYPPVDHVDPLRAARGLHVHDAVVHKQIAPLDQADAHLLRQERVLEIGAVVDAGREQHDAGIFGRGGRRQLAQVVRSCVV